MTAMQNPNESNVKIVPNPETLREELSTVKEELRRLMRQSVKEVDIARQSELQMGIAALNRRAAKLMDQLGLSSVFKEDRAKETRRKFIPTQDLTVDQLLTLAAAGKVTPEGAAALSELRSLPGVVSVITPWVPPPFPASPDAQSVAAYLSGCKTFTPLQAVLRCPKDPHFKPAGGLKNLATVTQPPQYVGQDGEWIAMLQQVPVQFAGQRKEILAALERAVTGYYVASGPVEGWLARIVQGDRRPHPNFVLTEDEFREVLRALPYDGKLAPNFGEVSFLDLLKTVRVNGAAGAGMPRHYKKAVVMKEMLQDAAQYYELLTQKKLATYMSQFPGEFLTVAKMKLDRYQADDWGKKVRPYYNLNGGLALIYSAVVQAYSACLIGFWQDPTSCNAHGFAWNSGGGDRLYSWVLWASRQAPGLYAIGYSDDGIWVLVGEDHEVYVSDKDVEQMDSSCGNAFLPPYREHLLKVLDPKLTPGWRNVAQAAAAAVFRQVVIVYKSLIYKSENKVHSGMPGTAEADQVAFTVLYVLLRAAYAKTSKDQPAFERFNEALTQVTGRIGLKFKASEWHKFRPNEDSYPWEFLGKRLHKFRGHYLPVVSLEKAVVQLVTPKSNRGGLDGQRAWVERARGLAVTSLFWHEPLYELAKQAYQRKAKTGVRPAATMDGEETGENDLDQILGQGLQIKFPDDSFPTRSWIYNLYLGLPIVETEPVLAPVVQPMQSAASAFDSLFPDNDDAVAGESWAESKPPVPERVQVEKALIEGQRVVPPTLPVAATTGEQYQLVKLPEEIKRAYNDSKRQAFVRFGNMFEKRKGQYMRGGRMEQLLNMSQGTETITFTKEGIKRAWESAVDFDSGMATFDVDNDDEWAEYDQEVEADADIDSRLQDEEEARLEAAYRRRLRF